MSLDISTPGSTSGEKVTEIKDKGEKTMTGVVQDVKFWGKGSRQIYEWAKENADEGVFFARVFGYDYENADEDEWDSWEEDFGTDRLCNSSCYAKDIDGDSFMVYLYDHSLPIGVYS